MIGSPTDHETRFLPCSSSVMVIASKMRHKQLQKKFNFKE